METAKRRGVDSERYSSAALRWARRGEPIPLPRELRPDEPLADPPADSTVVPA